MEDRIASIRVRPFNMRFRQPFVMSIGEVVTSQHILVQLATASGVVGVGEAAFETGPIFSEETQQSAIGIIRDYITPLLVGQEVSRLEAHSANMDRQIKGNPFAKSAVEMAMLDAWAKLLKLPLYQVLGGMVNPLHQDACHIAMMDVGKEVDKATCKARAGYSLFKLKVGAGRLALDIERIAALRESLGSSARIGIDANGGWNVRQAKRVLREVEPFKLDFIEQPVAGTDLAGMAELRKHTDVPLMADESVFTPVDALRVAQQKAADIISIKISKSGGLLNAKRIAAIADAAGISCYIGNMAEGGIGAAAGLHFAASSRNADFGCELSVGDYEDDADIVVNSPVANDGYLRVSDGLGLGITLREESV